ncbi:hypothetical protein ACFY7Z_10615 [Streptomyces sp. NPDC012623]|uniref:hypothetical protein n=1 Tax=unclassified Streptomyces TaxID=2593676 RepID=UPI003676E20A
MTARTGDAPRPRIPGMCWIPHPDDALRCTESEGHSDTADDHYHWPTKTFWPRYEGEHQ